MSIYTSENSQRLEAIIISRDKSVSVRARGPHGVTIESVSVPIGTSWMSVTEKFGTSFLISRSGDSVRVEAPQYVAVELR